MANISNMTRQEFIQLLEKREKGEKSFVGNGGLSL